MVLDFQGVGFSSGGVALWAGVVSDPVHAAFLFLYLLIMMQDLYLGRIYNLRDSWPRNLQETSAASILQ